MVLESKSTSDEDIVTFIEMTTNDLVDYINLVEKGVAGFDIIYFNLKVLWVKCYQTESCAIEKSFLKVNRYRQFHCCLI